MLITNVTCYDGRYKYGDGSFRVMVDLGNDYVTFFVSEDQIVKDAVWSKSSLDNQEEFPQAIGKFDSELIALDQPIEIDSLESYDQVDYLLTEYFRRYGVDFI